MEKRSVLEERDRRERRREREAERNRAFENRQRESRRQNEANYQQQYSNVNAANIYGESFTVSYKGEKKKKKSSVLRVVLKILISLVVILAIAVGAMYGLFRLFVYGKTNYQSSSQGYTITTDVAEEDEATLDSSEAEKVVELKKVALEDLSEELNRDTGTYNILLIGVDRRDDSWYGNSDVMILATINYDRETIYLTSFMRDLFADIPDVGIRKLNASCAYGGALLCVETIKQNYGVQIDNYAMVDFNGMINIIDAIGGIDLEVTEDELPVMNGLAAYMAEVNGEDPSAHQVTSAGLVHLDGYTATGYARNRSAGNTSDFGRTERQRKVLNAIFEKAKAGGLGSISDVVNEVLPFITHDVKQSTIFHLVTKATSILDFKIEQVRVPFDNEYSISNEILIPTDIGDTITKVRNTLY